MKKKVNIVDILKNTILKFKGGGKVNLSFLRKIIIPEETKYIEDSDSIIEDDGEIEITEPGIVTAEQGKGFTRIDTSNLLNNAGGITITEPGYIEAQEGTGYTGIDTTALIKDAGHLDIYTINDIADIGIYGGKGYSSISLKLNKLPEDADVVIYMKRTDEIDNIEHTNGLWIYFNVPCKLYLIKNNGNYLDTPTEISGSQEFFQLVNGLNSFLVYGATNEYENINLEHALAMPIQTDYLNSIIEAFAEYSKVGFRFDLDNGINHAVGSVGTTEY